MNELILSTVTGFAVGVLFAKLKLPVPAPATLAGVLGVVGLFLGYYLAGRLWIR
ncbi:XapX domain-containing protein [Desulforamulus aeronauticus]|uniref:PEP-CTERM protein-sorting domain-containing protein/XapX domain-containing protein n=1 Tax=Desulforamulus aeronauticus DSM 10349 TaxID=1121421 RepID=A0A1M6T1D3_9FIRM|nr:XapX domain-containing protein [Desulforamulus aeronauticus]SHK50812.1 PEP-CTERM protein-sorting domain-containing protein/XapX domain-containing protein [Desulforamulus aeronauticus DSM 10349]